jgi:hypothetical protein
LVVACTTVLAIDAFTFINVRFTLAPGVTCEASAAICVHKVRARTLVITSLTGTLIHVGARVAVPAVAGVTGADVGAVSVAARGVGVARVNALCALLLVVLALGAVEP